MRSLRLFKIVSDSSDRDSVLGEDMTLEILYTVPSAHHQRYHFVAKATLALCIFL